jgi:hypothetical protein
MIPIRGVRLSSVDAFMIVLGIVAATVATIGWVFT